jgi:hypothetical protein
MTILVTILKADNAPEKFVSFGTLYSAVSHTKKLPLPVARVVILWHVVPVFVGIVDSECELQNADTRIMQIHHGLKAENGVDSLFQMLFYFVVVDEFA